MGDLKSIEIMGGMDVKLINYIKFATTAILNLEERY